MASKRKFNLLSLQKEENKTAYVYFKIIFRFCTYENSLRHEKIIAKGFSAFAGYFKDH